MIKIRSKNGIYSHSHFTEQRVSTFKKSPWENNLNHKSSNLLIQWFKSFTGFSRIIHTQLGNSKSKQEIAIGRCRKSPWTWDPVGTTGTLHMGCKMRTTDGKNQRVRNRELEQAILPVRSNSRAGELRLENTDAGGRNESLRLTKKAAERTNHEQTKITSAQDKASRSKIEHTLCGIRRRQKKILGSDSQIKPQARWGILQRWWRTVGTISRISEPHSQKETEAGKVQSLGITRPTRRRTDRRRKTKTGERQLPNSAGSKDFNWKISWHDKIKNGDEDLQAARKTVIGKRNRKMSAGKIQRTWVRITNAEKKSKLVSGKNEFSSCTGLQHRDPSPTEERQQTWNRSN
jgi:hypothetical protein